MGAARCSLRGKILQMPLWQPRISSSAQFLIRQCAPLRFPIDLTKLAVKRGIREIHFRPMPCDGAIEATAEGFVVQLNSDKDQRVPSAAVDSAALSPRQRFTLAHEIGHTFFYDGARRAVRPHPNPRLLESLCNQAAQILLLPEFLIAREIGVGRRFDSIEMARDLASSARVSPEVVLQRLEGIENLKETDYALFSLRLRDDGMLITTGVCLHGGAFSTLPSPVLHAPPPKWLSSIMAASQSSVGVVHRSALGDGWEFASRCVHGNRVGDLVFVEIRVEMVAARVAV